MRKLILVVSLLLATNLFGVSGPYFVRNDGSNSNNGLANTAGGAWHDISYAQAHAVTTGGVTIHVAGGTYGENVVCPDGRHAIICATLSGPSNTQRVILLCDGACLLRNTAPHGGIIVSGSNLTVKGGFDYGNDPDAQVNLMIECPYNHDSTGPGTCPQSQNVTVDGVSLHDTGQNATSFSGANGCPDFGMVFIGTRGFSVVNVVINGIRAYNYGLSSSQKRNGGSCNTSHGFYADAAGIVITNSIFIESGSTGGQFYSTPCNEVFANNTIIRPGNQGVIFGGGDCNPVGKISAINNYIDSSSPGGGIALGTGGGPPCTSTSRILAKSNMFTTTTNQVGNPGTCTDTSGSITEPNGPTATFASPGTSGGNGDYHIKAGSLTISHGTISCVSGQTNCAPSLDKDGVVRSATAPTIGAYEFGASSVTPPSAPTSLGVVVQ